MNWLVTRINYLREVKKMVDVGYDPSYRTLQSLIIVCDPKIYNKFNFKIRDDGIDLRFKDPTNK
jgi:hypothetical protein